MSGALRNAAKFAAPTQSMAILISRMICDKYSTTRSDDSKAGFRSGCPIPATLAPKAMALATSSPLRIPPDATNSSSGTAPLTTTSASSVGIPQVAKALSVGCPFWAAQLLQIDVLV